MQIREKKEIFEAVLTPVVNERVPEAAVGKIGGVHETVDLGMSPAWFLVVRVGRPRRRGAGDVRHLGANERALLGEGAVACDRAVPTEREPRLGLGAAPLALEADGRHCVRGDRLAGGENDAGLRVREDRHCRRAVGLLERVDGLGAAEAA